MGKSSGRSVREVQVQENDGPVVEHTTQSEVETAIWDQIHRKRFYLAEEAPICKGKLRGEFGYLSVSPTARAILNGTYVYPADFDEDTKDICRECARIRAQIPMDSVTAEVTEECWKKGWSKAKEDTPSSESGLHFGHYKASTKDCILAQFHTLKASLIMKHGMVLNRWSRGVSVMLEKLFGCTLVSKLRSILLMEADFNFVNKQVYGCRMIGNARKYKLMPDEIFSERNRMAEDGTLAKTLVYDLARQTRRPAGLASVDAESCYDRIAHAVASLVFQAFGVPDKAVVAMLKTIQDMKFFLRTAYGDSVDFATSSIEVKSQGLCQGNGAAPAGWTVISITLLNAHKERGHSASFKCPISRREGKIVAIIYVDDTDLLHINLDRQEIVEETHQALQESITSWGNLLLASGGSLKPEKCFVYMIDFDWLPDGTWKYANTTEDEQFEVRIPTASGRMALIERLGVNDAKKTLGYMTCPSGNPASAIKRMQEQADEWVDKAKGGGLQQRYVWFMMDKQLWPRVGYAICNNMASLRDLSSCLSRQYYKLLPLGGVVRSAPKELRQLSCGFYGIGCPHPGVECLAAQLNKLVMHYGCNSSLGLQLQTSMEYFTIELGMSAQPFSVNYDKYQGLVTHSWIKTIWEKCQAFRVEVDLGSTLEPPRQGDKWLMNLFVAVGYVDSELEALNRVRQYLQVIFLSDVLEAGGRYIDQDYVHLGTGEKRSEYDFPRESPSVQDEVLWQQALQQIAPRGRVVTALRAFERKGHKIWRWQLYENRQILTYLPEHGDIQYYAPVEGIGQRSRPNRWGRIQERVVGSSTPLRVSVKEVAPDTWSIHSSARTEILPLPITLWLDVLVDWDTPWMWENMCIEGDENWIVDSLSEGTCMAVTDGSYMESLDPTICSAAFILECQKGRGRISGSFCEQSSVACSYRGELLGLLAIHLIILGVTHANEGLHGEVQIYSDCNTALWTIQSLPPTMIPARFKHADILKLILIHCKGDKIVKKYTHVPAHQDDEEDFADLSRQSQLNCLMDQNAKQRRLGRARTPAAKTEVTT